MFFRLLYLVPKNWLSYFLGIIVHSRLPFQIHTIIRNWFIRFFNVDISESQLPLAKYPTLGDFFIRHLKPGARSIHSDELISPVDGTLTQGAIFNPSNPRLLQIKGIDYSLKDLVGSNIDLKDYLSGSFLTIYLAPYNYHRIHSPIDGQITQVAYIPGALWPVNTWSVNHIPGLFVVNERIIVEVSGKAGKVLVIMVGATNVGRITLDFNSEIFGNGFPPAKHKYWRPTQALGVEKGGGLGCFELGSTVILISSQDLSEKINPSLFGSNSQKVVMGQGFGLSL